MDVLDDEDDNGEEVVPLCSCLMPKVFKIAVVMLMIEVVLLGATVVVVIGLAVDEGSRVYDVRYEVDKDTGRVGR